MDKSSLHTAIEDIKKIKTDYERKEECSQLLIERIKELESDLLDRFYTLMSKPVVKKPRAKKQQAKTIPDKQQNIKQ
jgi:hypothetical protein